MYKEKVLEEMKKIYKDVSFAVEHTRKVLKYAEDIMEGENISQHERELVSIVAMLHDVDALEAQRKNISLDNSYQQREGTLVAKEILESVGYYPNNIKRVCYIISTHDTPDEVEGIDFQIQWEADLLANLESTSINKNKEEMKKWIGDNFKTTTGATMAYNYYIFG